MEQNGLANPGDSIASGAVKVEVSTQPPAWEDYLARHPQACVYHDGRWGEVMQAAYGNTPFYLTARRAGSVVGVLQLIEQKSLLFGRHLCSLPYFDSAGILAVDGAVARAVLDQARELREARKAEWVELRHLDPIEPAHPTRTDKVTLRLPLPADEESLWKQLKAKVRNQVRKAQRESLTAEQGGAELLADFHAAYVRNMRDLGSPPHGAKFFRLILEAFPAESKLFVVRLAGKAVAASFTLADRHGLRVPWAASDWRLRRLGANMLLYWSMLTEGCRIGAGRFDFGRSTRDAGTYKFKKQWGAEEVPLYWHYLLAEGRPMPQPRPESGKYRLMIACWRRLPLWAARVFGPALIGKLS